MWWKDQLPIDGVYVHIPFCKNLCGYCGFVKQTPTSYVDQYATTVAQELKYLTQNFSLQIKPKTLYFGGGTPSLFEGKMVEHISHELSSVFSLEELEEFTVEANPSDISINLLGRLKDIGVTRLSIGIQSPVSSILLNLQRIQHQQDVIKAGEILSASPFALNMDLIYGCPGMSLHHIEESISQLLKCNISHISAYELTLHKSHPSSPYRPDDDIIVQQALLIRSLLASAGFTQYEVSNYAKPGYESKHNLNYWNFKNVLGLGVGAHSSLNFIHKTEGKLTNLNWTNPAATAVYTNTCSSTKHPLHQTKPQNSVDTEKLFLVAHLRKQQGFLLQTYQDYFGKNFLTQYSKTVHTFRDKGWLTIHQNKCQPTAAGLFFLDSILIELFDELEKRGCLTLPAHIPI